MRRPSACARRASARRPALCSAILLPRGQARLGGLEQLGRLLAEDRGDVRRRSRAIWLAAPAAVDGLVRLRRRRVRRARRRRGRLVGCNVSSDSQRRLVAPSVVDGPRPPVAPLERESDAPLGCCKRRGRRATRLRMLDVRRALSRSTISRLRRVRLRDVQLASVPAVGVLGQRAAPCGRPARRDRALGRRGQIARDLGVERVLERVPAGDQPALVEEETRVLVDVIDDLLEAAARCPAAPRAPRPACRRVVVQLADVAIQRLGDLDALARAGGLRRAAQRVAGAMQVLGDRVRRRRTGSQRAMNSRMIARWPAVSLA